MEISANVCIYLEHINHRWPLTFNVIVFLTVLPSWPASTGCHLWRWFALTKTPSLDALPSWYFNIHSATARCGTATDHKV